MMLSFKEENANFPLPPMIPGTLHQEAQQASTMTTIFKTTSTSLHMPPQAAATTIFTPPSFCGSYIDKSLWLTHYTTQSSCFPGEPSIPGGMADVYYSPAICPRGYSVDCTATEDDLGVSFLPGETAWFCCPRYVSNYAFYQ